jgi:hypothetical protein
VPDPTASDPQRQNSPALACAACGAASPSPTPPATWSAAVTRGRRTWTCERCARDHIRSIEGKLDQEWW